MGTIEREDGLLKDEKCHICGEIKATGYWAGDTGAFCVCQRCAIETLPILIVDSLNYYYLKDLTRLDNVLTQIKEVFWKTAFTRVMVNAREKDKEKGER